MWDLAARFGGLTGARCCRAFLGQNAWFKQAFLPHVATVPLRPAPFGIGAVAGTPGKRGATRTEDQMEQRRQRHYRLS
jgi:hypothetical protein